MTKIVFLRKVTLLMKVITEKQLKIIKQRIIEACKNDLGYTMKLCAYSQ